MLLSLLLALTLPQLGLSGVDSNSEFYPFGQNPNAKRRMYFPDAVSVLRNLDKFGSLHVRFHNCAWSPNTITAFDDDGEYYDGEDAWYQGRTAGGSAANAGFSLYGTLKHRLQLGGCRRATYINSFFTNNGADVLVDALGLNGVDQSYTYCHEYEWNNDDDQNGDNGNNNNNQGNGDNQNSYPQSATLGCTADGEFATALFTDQYCQGNYFWNTTTDDKTYKSYNRKLKQVRCHKIWNGNEDQNSDSEYKTVVHEVLLQSDVCDTRVNPLCPNPWGRKRAYETKLRLAGAGSRAVFEYRVRRPLIKLFHFLIFLSLVVTLVAYRARNRERLQAHGWATCLAKDLPKWLGRRIRAVRKFFRGGRSRRRGPPKQSRRRRRRRGRDEYPVYDDEDMDEQFYDEDAGCGQIIIDDSRDVLESPSYEMASHR